MLETILQQHVVPIIQWFISLFTPAEWKAFVLVVFVTIAVTQMIKVGWRLLPIPADHLTYQPSILYLISCAVAFICAAFIWPKGFNWWIPGLISGPAAAFLFKVGFAIIKKAAPDIAASFNADRRREDLGPQPDSIGRKTDKK